MAVYASTQTLAKYLVDGFYSASGSSDYSFDTSSSNVITVNISGLTASGKEMALKALDAYEAVADISFRTVTSGGDIRFSDDTSITFKSTMYTGPITLPYMNSKGIDYAAINIPLSWQTKYGTDVGSYGFQLYLHEIGHALGLGHLGTYGGGAPFSQAKFTTDSWMQSAMSYFDQSENPNVAASKGYLLTPMMADIMGLHMLYGKATGGPTAGNTVYGKGSDLGTYLDSAFRGTEGSLTKNFLVIFDANGYDTIDFSNDTKAQKINLQGGTFSTSYGWTDNMGIAHGTVIERFYAGSASDRVDGNGANNNIKLNSGNDFANGKGGNDVIRGNAGSDQIKGGGGTDKLYGGTGSDKIWGEGGNDSLFGEDGNDRLNGGQGNDVLTGGRGYDTFIFQSGRDTVVDFRDDQDTLAIDNALWGNKSLTKAQVLAMAKVTSTGDIRFDFAGDHELVIRNLTDVNDLMNDLTIV